MIKPLPALMPILGAALASFAPAAEPGRPPNVVVLLADDAAWGDFSFNGNTNAATPNLDQLARDGAVLDRFYTCPVCAPTRAEFLTGRYYLRTGLRGVNSGQERIDLDEKTIGDAFKSAGYVTGIFGKWHNGAQWPYHPNARGFDEFYGFTTGHSGSYFDAPLDHNGEPVRGHGYIADDLTDHALEFIARHRDRPFFCYVPFNTPHAPFCVPDAFWERFEKNPVALRGPEGDREDLARTRTVLAMGANLDWNVGRVLERLAKLGLAENTIVVFFSDNGPAHLRWNGGMKGKKGTLDEGGVREPCAIRWPGKIAPGTHVREIAGAIDLLPTLASLAGLRDASAKPLDGLDLAPLLLGRATVWPERFIFSHTGWNGRVSVRTPRYRLDGVGALFDLDTDPGQHTDIATRHPKLVAQLTQAVAAWRLDVSGGVSGAPDRSRARPASATSDDRPFLVGYRERPFTLLPAGDGMPHGGVKRSAAAPNNSYFTQWTSLADSITWDIQVQQAGDYEIVVHYTCPPADAGSTIEVSFNGTKLSNRVAPAWDPPLVLNEDRVPRETESYVKEFRPLPCGRARLAAGRGLLTLRATSIAGRQVADVSLVTLRLETPATSR